MHRLNGTSGLLVLLSCAVGAISCGGDDGKAIDAGLRDAMAFDGGLPDPAIDAAINSCARKAYSLIDVTGTITTDDTIAGVPDLSLTGIDLTDTYTLPWSFPFFGNGHTEITVDTNSNIWFAANANAESEFNLPAGGAQALPVISVWNETLTSDDYGDGLEIENLNTPDRVLFVWETEETDDSGNYTLNNFRATLFPNGYILVSYDTFETTICDDAGSGISKATGSDFVDITAQHGKACDTEGKRYLLEPPCGPTDLDDDGLDDALEASLGTSPSDDDSDDDGLKDGWEHFITGTNPLL